MTTNATITGIFSGLQFSGEVIHAEKKLIWVRLNPGYHKNMPANNDVLLFHEADKNVTFEIQRCATQAESAEVSNSVASEPKIVVPARVRLAE